MTCTRKHVSKRVYASPTKSRMDVKEESVECSWPIIYYVIDDFEDMFEHLMVHGQEYLCVELGVSLPSDTPALNQTNGSIGSIARSGRSPYNDHHDGPQAGKPFPTGSTRGFGQDISGGIGSGGPGAGGVHGKITLFQGAASFQSLVGIYQQKASAKVAKRFKLGPRKVPQEFVMMRGPGGRGHAQVAITASDRLDDLSAAATGGGPGGLTSASETHLSRYHQSSAASLSSSPPLSNSALFMRAGQQQQQHQQKAHGDEKKVHPYPSDHQSLPRTSLDSQGRHRWSNGHHYQQPTPQATTVRQHSHRQYPPVAPSSSFFASPSQPTPPSSGNGDVSTIKAPPSKLSPTRSFSTGSFFNSLRKLSLATLAHATGSNQNHYRSPSPPPSPPPAPLPPHSLDTASSSSASASSSPYQSPSPSNGPGSRPRLHSFPQGPRGAMDEYEDEDTDTQSGSIRSGISAHGTGSRQEIEALVRDPKSLKCCMTFVNVPWTAIATTLMDFAYQQYLPSVTTATRKLKTTMVATNMPGNGATVHPK
ncbi:hypothetical protein DFQ27_006058 [Actinomortierella ambigua]|uniref:Uncharacterized protein n=1 Tax=Actinomortierella ambigua TaxID=1343610 RepID=A0A9P6PZ67_9FUNG|nr:hypothetical protein DFQ27_006058 [Actinomortierella ambigua]